MYTAVESGLRFRVGVTSQGRDDVALRKYHLGGVGERVNNRSDK
jgi:hypothetical protein